MALVSMASMVCDAWERATTLAGYGHEPLTVGWHQGLAYVRLWDFRRGSEGWRRLPSRDGQQPVITPKWDPFRSLALYDVLWRA